MTTAQKKITLILPSEIKEEVLLLKKELKTSMNSIFLQAIENFLKTQRDKKLRLEAKQMVKEYQENPELQELADFEEDIIAY